MDFSPIHLVTGFRQLYEWLVGQYDTHFLETQPDSYSEKVSPTLFSGSYSLGLLALFVSRAQAFEPHTVVTDPDKDLTSEDGMHFFSDVTKIRDLQTNKIKEAIAQNSTSYITVDLLPNVHISHLKEIRDEEGHSAWLFNFVRAPDQRVILENYVLMPGSQHETPSLDDHHGFDARLNSDGTLTFSIKNAKQQDDGSPFPLACQFKNNGPTVLVDKEGRIKKVLIGTLAQSCVINGHEIPEGSTVTNINFNEQGEPFPDFTIPICSYNLDIKGSCAFPPDGRLDPIPLNH